MIGGGCVGAGCAWEAATRGLKVALIERDDFAAGTSGYVISKRCLYFVLIFFQVDILTNISSNYFISFLYYFFSVVQQN